MTVTSPLARRDDTAPWSVADLFALPDDGYRYEIFDGSLLVTPQPAMPHVATVFRLRRLLDRQAPDDLVVVEGAGIYPTETDYYIPDLVVIRSELLSSRARGIKPPDALLAIEVVAPSNPGNDLVLKREVYASLGIREYWIVDERDRTVHILLREPTGKYREAALRQPGTPWRSPTPFPLTLDPADIF